MSDVWVAKAMDPGSASIFTTEEQIPCLRTINASAHEMS